MRRRFFTKKLWLSVIACLVTGVMFFTSAPALVLEGAYEPEYVSELCVFYSDNGSMESAIQKCEQAGFIPLRQDLNPAEDSQRVVLGYKKTKERKEAITDVRALYMGLGYSEYTYDDVLEAQNAQMDLLAQELIISCEEFQHNYEKGSPAARTAYEILNHFWLEEMDSFTLLGDYLLSEDCRIPENGDESIGAKNLAYYLKHGSTSFSNTLYAALVAAVADYNPTAEYVGGEYEIDVAVAETMPTMTIPPEMVDGVAADLGVEEVVSSYLEEQTTTQTIETETVAEQPDVTTEAEALPEVEHTELTPIEEAALSEEAETSPVETEPPAEADEPEAYEETEESEETEETEETTTTVEPQEVVRVVLECDKNYGNWASRIAKTGMTKYWNDDNYAGLFDTAYRNKALNIKSKIQDFSARYQEAAARKAAKNNQAEEPAIEADGDLDMVEAVVEKSRSENQAPEENADTAYLAAYEILNKYAYDEHKTVAEYLVETGNIAYKTYDELRRLYPLLAAMTDGQAQMMQMNGVVAMAMYLENDDQISEQAAPILTELDQSIEDYNGETYISVFEGVDRKSRVAVTDQLKARQVAGAAYKTMTEPYALEQTLDMISNKMQLASQIVGAVSAIVTLGGMFIGKSLTFGICYEWITTCGFWGAIGGIGGMTLLAFPIVTGIAILLLSVIKMCVQFIRKLISDSRIEWVDIPPDVFDWYDNYYIPYHAVPDCNGKFADLNAGTGERWVALYYTRTESGSPICVPQEGEPFYYSRSERQVTGYTCLKEFNTVEAADLDAYTDDDDTPNIYLHFKTLDNVNVKMNTGTDSGDTRYISSIMLSQEENETAAKTKLTKAGYTVIDYNLTPYTDKGIFYDTKYYCYLGYMTQNNPTNAITDIRILPRCSDSAVAYGAGTYAMVGTTKLGDSIYCTTSTMMGDPITANFDVVNDPSKAQPGWEPVATFGGFAYNFNQNYSFTTFVKEVEQPNPSAQDYLNHVRQGIGKELQTYVYFKPSKMYTAEENTPYLGGFAILMSGDYFNEQDENHGIYTRDDPLYTSEAYAAYIASLNPGGARHNFNLMGSNTNGQVITCTTYNPKRAIYGFKSYTCSPLGLQLASSLGVSSKGACVACDVITLELDRYVDGITEPVEGPVFNIGYSAGHNYYCYEPRDSRDKKDDRRLIGKPEDYEQENFWSAPYSKAGSYVKWSQCEVRKKGIYIQGNAEGLTPLSMSDVVFSHDKLGKDDKAVNLAGQMVNMVDYLSVQDFKTPNAETPHDLSIQLARTQNECRYNGSFYIYVNNRRTEKPYISSLTVRSYELYSYAEKAQKMNVDTLNMTSMDMLNRSGDDICVMGLLASCDDEIFPFDISCYNAMEQHNDDVWIGKAYFSVASKAISFASTISGIFSSSAENRLDQYNTEMNARDNVRIWQEDLDKYLSNECSYFGVTRTDNEMEAIKGIIKYKPENGNAPQTLKVDNVTYTRCGDPVYDSIEGAYYIYTTTDTGAFPGRPLTAVTLSSYPLLEGSATARTATAPGTRSKMDSNCLNFIHAFYSDEGQYMDSIVLGHGKNYREALCELLDMDCCNVIFYDLRESSPDDCLFIGYTKYTPLTANDRAKKTGAIRDIRIFSECNPELTKQLDGRTYKRALDIYSYEKNYNNAISVNADDQAYIYYTSQGTETPIERIGIAQRDRVPDKKDGLQVWENVLSAEGARYNLNNGYITFSEKDSDVVGDNRLYLFAKRLDNSIAFGHEIVGGHCEEMLTYGNLYYQIA